MDRATKRANRIKNILVWFEQHPNEKPSWITNPSEMKKHLPVGPKQKPFMQGIWQKIADIFSAWFGSTEETVQSDDSGETIQPSQPNTQPDTPNIVVVTRKPIKKALLVGINKHQFQGADLQGCVNDVENMRDVLVKLYGFPLDNIRVLTDYRATKAAILKRLHWLIDDSVNGDELVFHYSGHGSKVRDRNGDELDDGMDEILIPTDHDWSNPLTDDNIGNIFRNLAHGANLTMFCDACHSGSMSRSIAPIQNTRINDRFLQPPFDIVARSEGRDLKVRQFGKSPKATQRHVLISGCKDNQTSADAYINKKYQGAFTWAITKAIEENPNNTCKEIHARTLDIIRNYSQVPQLSGDPDVLTRTILGGTK